MRYPDPAFGGEQEIRREGRSNELFDRLARDFVVKFTRNSHL